MPRRFCPLVLTIVLALAAAPAAQAAARSAPQTQYYLSLGDSYAVGYQAPVMRPTRNGPANQLVALAARRGYRYRLINFGCAGATTTSMLDQVNCPAAARAPGAPAYPGHTQVQAAVAFIKQHPGRVGLVTVSIGGNDVDGCITKADTLGCVARAMPTATANLTKIVKRLRAAGTKRMRIIGSTYPDVVLGAWVLPAFGANRFTLVSESLTAFAKLINPGLKKAYSSVGARFVDVTAATGAYGPFDSVATRLHGNIPAPVEEVCKLTYFCTYVNIHMTTAGYGIIAKLEVATLPPVVNRKS